MSGRSSAAPPPAPDTPGDDIDRLRALVRRQDRVLSLQREVIDHLAHEVRTPIAAIQNATYLIDTYGRENPAQADKWRGMIKEAAEALRTLMADLVDTERLNASARALTRRTESPDEVVRALVAQSSGAARIRLETTPAAAALRSIDRSILECAFRALLDNALKFSPPDRPVEVSVDAAAATLRIAIADRGCGVPAGEADALFAPYHRASNVDKIPGSGLGLATARCAAELHGGSVTFESREGGGSTFVLTLHAPE